jgi:hypothetical protein
MSFELHRLVQSLLLFQHGLTALLAVDLDAAAIHVQMAALAPAER